MKLITSLLLLLVSVSTVKAQFFRAYHPGCYYTKDGKKVTGLISSQPYSTTIYFKANKDDKPTKLSIKDIKAIINSGQLPDSLTVLTENSDIEKSYFAEFVVESPKIKFYHKLKKITSGGAPVMSTGVSVNPSARGSAPSFTNTYSWSSSPTYTGLKPILMYTDGNTTHILSKSNFRVVLLEALSDSPEHVKQLQGKKVKFKRVEEFLMSYKFRKQ